MIKFIDLFAGMGGLRTGFEKGFKKEGLETQSVFTSEIKPHAIKALQANFPHENFVGDITKVDAKEIPEFEFLLAGFPCQSFSAAGNRQGFADTRGTLFFDIERILKEKKPYGFILENVDNLAHHDKLKKTDKMGQTLTIILKSLADLGYNVSWKVLDSKEFGVAQSRKRTFIVGVKEGKVSLDDFPIKTKRFKDVQETSVNFDETEFSKLLLSKLQPEELYGKTLRDYRNGPKVIHSWWFEARGPLSKKEKKFLDIFAQEYNKVYKHNGLVWGRDVGKPLEVIKLFYKDENLEETLNSLVKKGYLNLRPTRKTVEVIGEDGVVSKKRVEDDKRPWVYVFTTGQLSFPFTKFINPEEFTPTLTATDMNRLGVVDEGGLRKLTKTEGLRLFGFPDDYSFVDLPENKCYDLLGNTVVVPVVEKISERLAKNYKNSSFFTPL